MSCFWVEKRTVNLKIVVGHAPNSGLPIEKKVSEGYVVFSGDNTAIGRSGVEVDRAGDLLKHEIFLDKDEAGQMADRLHKERIEKLRLEPQEYRLRNYTGSRRIDVDYWNPLDPDRETKHPKTPRERAYDFEKVGKQVFPGDSLIVLAQTGGGVEIIADDEKIGGRAIPYDHYGRPGREISITSPDKNYGGYYHPRRGEITVETQDDIGAFQIDIKARR